jgi:hypothetical protein
MALARARETGRAGARPRIGQRYREVAERQGVTGDTLNLRLV